MSLYKEVEQVKEALDKLMEHATLETAKEVENTLVQFLTPDESPFAMKCKLEAAENALTETMTERDMEKAANDICREALHRVNDHVQTLQEKIASLTIQFLAAHGWAQSRDTWKKTALDLEYQLGVAQREKATLQSEVELLKGAVHQGIEVRTKLIDAERLRDEAQRQVTELKAKCERLQEQIENVNRSQTRPIWTQCTYFKDLPLFGQPVVVCLPSIDTISGKTVFGLARLDKTEFDGLQLQWRFEDGSCTLVTPNDLWCPSPWPFK